MRGAFDKTCDWWYGPESVAGTPNTMYAPNVPCRVVFQEQIFQQEFPFSMSIAWLTNDEVIPNIPVTISPRIGYTYDNWFQADRVAIPSGTEPGWYVSRRELVSPFGRASYWRVLLLPLDSMTNPPWPPPSPIPPLPPLPPSPGLTCADAGELLYEDGVIEFDVPGPVSWFYVEFDEGDVFHVTGEVTAGSPPLVVMSFQGGTCSSPVGAGGISLPGCNNMGSPWWPRIWINVGVSGTWEGVRIKLTYGPGGCP